jgi:FAD/FMN-containing dehydrogenase
MSETKIVGLDGSEKTISGEDLAAFGASLRGDLLTRDSEGYDKSRSIWNAMIDKKPALVARCAGVADVISAVKFAAARKLRIAVRGAGHNIAGTAICDDGLLLDLSAWRSVHVDPKAKTARVEPGATLGDLDHESQAFALATPTGVNSTTGIAGLTLGGGFGWLSRKHGLTIDNLRSADVVTADGTLRHCSADENSDLFWAIRGGGGNFGVVTSFEFNLHEVGPQVLAGLVVHPFEKAKEVLQHYRSCVTDMSDNLCIWTVSRKAPPLPFLPAEWHGKEVVILAACYVGDMKDGEKELKKLREWGEPIADVISPHPFAGWQQAFDPLLAPGARNYWKSHNFSKLSDEVIDVAVDFGKRLPSEQTEIFFARVGGAINRVAADATAYPHRDAEFVLNLHARWEDKKDDEACVAWARDFFKASEPYATGGVYVNFIPNDEERVPNAYGPNLARLKELKKKYDPNNLFRVNQNISA